MVIYCLKYGNAEIKEYFIHLFVLFCVRTMWYFSMLCLAYLYYFHCILYIPIVCPKFIMCCTYVEVSLLHFIVRICSLNHVLNKCPVWPVYCRAQSMHLSLYAPLLFNILFLCWCHKHVRTLHIYPMKKWKKHRNQHNKTHFTTEPVPSTPLKTKIKQR